MANFINEDGLYDAILESRKPEARKFRKWVTSEVLPSIRKHGIFATPVTIDNLINNPEFGIKLLQTLKEEREQRELAQQKVDSLNHVVKQQLQIINEKDQALEKLNKRVSYYDMILESKTLLDATQIAKDYGYSAIAFNKMLRDYGIQYKVNKSWVLKNPYHTEGYTHTHSGITETGFQYNHMQWTQKGRLFLYDFLKSKGILPSIEKEQ